ncbi:transglutaminase family protein [soil metagenome]
MSLRVTHTTRYRYASPVVENLNEIRTQPVDDGIQKLLAFGVTATPGKVISQYRDFYANTVHFAEATAPHTTLEIASTAEVAIDLPKIDHDDLSAIPFSALAGCRNLPECYDFLLPSHYIAAHQDTWRQALDLRNDEGNILPVALRAMRWVFDTFDYLPGTTTSDTPMIEAYSLRRGVCQDFAHVLIALLRSLEIPARYVSGYLYTGEDSALRGDQASHAWTEIYLPGHGWLSLDPTNNQVVGSGHIRVAVGRDYDDAAPIRGAYRGAAARTMDVEVTVTSCGALAVNP